ncbi:MAG: hypothetical protein ACRD1O_01185 [Terriglobia bacterium]
MGILDEPSNQKQPVVMPEPKPSHTGTFTAVFVILALLIAGEIYSLTKLSSLRTAVQSDQAHMAEQLNASLSAKVQDMETSNTQSLDALRAELESTTTRMSATEKKALKNAHYAGYLAHQLSQQQNQNAAEFRQELSRKADQQQVGVLSNNVSATQNDLANTKRTVGTLTSDLGMSRSKLGTMIATNHNDIVELRKLGSRDYYEFTLTQNHRENVAGVGLVLKKANTGHHTFNVDMFYNDMRITRKNLAIDQPTFFAPQYKYNFYELVVYQIAPHKVVGYVSTPKGAFQQQMAAAQ